MGSVSGGSTIVVNCMFIDNTAPVGDGGGGMYNISGSPLVINCGFTGNELGAAFLDLVGWVESGVKPAGDNWLDPAAVADPEFGCTFTDPTPGGHILATPCP